MFDHRADVSTHHTDDTATVDATCLPLFLMALSILLHRTPTRKEQHLDRHSQCSVQHCHHDQQYLASLHIRRAQHWVQISQQESDAQSEAYANKDVIQDGNLGPGDQGDRDPDQVRVAIQRPAFEEVGGLRFEVFEREEEDGWDDERVSVDEPCCT